MNFRKVIQIFLLSLLCWTFAGLEVQAETISQDGLQVTIETDKEQYQSNEKAKITVHVKNKNAYELKNISVESVVPKELLISKDSTLSIAIDQLNANESKEYIFYVFKENTTNKPTDEPTEKPADNQNGGSNTNTSTGTITKDNVSNDGTGTGIDIPWLPLTVLFVLSSGGLLLLRKNKRKSLFMLLLATTMGISALNLQPVMAQTEKKNFQVDINITYDKENYKIVTKALYDKQYGDINEVGEVTKDEWIATLVDTLGLSLQEKVNGYSFDDFDDTDKAEKIETAIQYNFLDLKANTDNMILFQPKEFATREFVAYTTIRALGYVPTEDDLKIKASDIAMLQYPGEDNIALDFGMLYMVGDSFKPNQYVTRTEIQNVIEKVKGTLNSAKIDKDHVDKVEFQNGVTESTLQYEVVENENKVFVYDKAMVKNWKKDEIHVLYSKDKSQKDIAIKISDIVYENDRAIITYTLPKIEEVANNIDLEGSKSVEGNFTPAEGIEMMDVPQTRMGISGTLPLLGPMKFRFTVDKVEVVASINLKEIEYRLNADLSWQHGLEINDIYFAILNENKAEISYKEKAKKPIKKEVGKFSIPIAYGACATGTIYLIVEVDGSISFTFTNTNKIGIQYNNNRLRPILNINNDIEFGKVEGSLKIGVSPELGGEWFGFDFLKLGMELGRKFETELPDVYTNPFGICLDGVNYMYGEYYAQIGPDGFNFRQEREVYNYNNSPSKLRLHIEETGIKADCTRNSKGNYKGIVKDIDSTIPIHKAKIQILKGNKIVDTTYSDRDGNFIGIKLSKGDYKLRVSSTGYQPYEKKFQIIGGETTYLETQLMVSNGNNGINSVCSGEIINAFTGGKVSDATIKIYKQHLFSQDQLIKEFKSDADGKYQLQLPVGNYEFVVNKEGFMANTKDITIGVQENKINITLNPENQGNIDGGLRFVLTWGEQPSDLDSHLTSDNLHVYYSEKIGKGANLDVDDTSSYGPETITITDPKQQVYHYYVHDFTNRTNYNTNSLSNSSAKIQVFDKEKLLYTFNIPQNQMGTLWHVFDIDYTSGKILPVNKFSYESDADNVGLENIENRTYKVSEEKIIEKE